MQSSRSCNKTRLAMLAAACVAAHRASPRARRRQDRRVDAQHQRAVVYAGALRHFG